MSPFQRPAAARAACVVAVLAATVALTGCGGGNSVTLGGTTPAGSSGRPAASSGSDTPSADPSGSPTDSASAGSASDQFRWPEIPVPVLPDISSVSRQAVAASKAVGDVVKVPGDLQVTGARCDAKGAVVNRSGMTVGGADDGSLVAGQNAITGKGVQSLDKNGGSLVSGGVTYSVAKDGSGSAVAGDTSVTVNADGSGSYVGPMGTYTVEADGSGSFVGDNYTYTVVKDGSGTYVGPLGTYAVEPDGSGTWTGDQGIFTAESDGTVTSLGATVKAPPMPRLPLLGRFPKLARLLPVGKPCGLLIRISASALFDFDSASLRPAAGPVLKSVAAALAKATGRVTVNGHTDSIGTDAYNLDLSQRRAQSVLDALTGDGVSLPMTPHGFGEAQPVAPNTLGGKDNPAGRQLNRRVEIVVS